MLYKRYPNRQRRYPRTGSESGPAGTVRETGGEGEPSDQLHRVDIPLPRNLGEPRTAAGPRGLFQPGFLESLIKRIQMDDIILIAIILLLLQEGIDDEILLLLLLYVLLF